MRRVTLRGLRVLTPLRVAAALVMASSGAAVAAGAQSAAPITLNDYLRTTVGLNAREVTDARNGRVAVKLLHTDLGRDVTVFGMVGIHVTREAYLAQIRDMRALISTRARTFGIIGDPVQPAEMQARFFDGSEWRGLKDCKVGDCSFKLPESLMQQFSQTVNWDGPNARQQVDSIMSGGMADLVTAYRARGDAAMVRYDDTNRVPAADAFAALLNQSQFLRDYAPAFRDYLLTYPAGRPDSVVDAVYWSVERIPHLRSTFALNQMLVYTPPSGPPLIARKQIFADHYFEASLELSAVFDAPDLAGGPGVYIVRVRRYRFDSLPRGIFNIRGRARGAVKRLMKSDLEGERKSIEAGTPR